jgi:hypothetical protein
MFITKSVLVLWFASASAACAASYGLAYVRSAGALVVLEKLDLGGGQAFASVFPSLLAFTIAIVCAIVAIGALLLSWRINKHPLLSAQHATALLFLAPLGVAMLNELGK